MSLKSIGISEEQLSDLKEALVAWRKEYKDGTSSRTLSVDSYLVGGMGAIDIILLPVVLSTGIADKLLSFALLALVVSLPLIASSLFISSLKKSYGITTYEILHVILIYSSFSTGFAAITAFIWHVSQVDGIVFLSLSVFLLFLSVFYGSFLITKKDWVPMIAELKKIVMTPDKLEQKDNATKVQET
jgi:hypothetical protein